MLLNQIALVPPFFLYVSLSLSLSFSVVGVGGFQKDVFECFLFCKDQRVFFVRGGPTWFQHIERLGGVDSLQCTVEPNVQLQGYNPSCLHTLCAKSITDSQKFSLNYFPITETEIRIFFQKIQIQKFGFLKLISISVILSVVSFKLISVSVIFWVDSQNYFLYLSFSGRFPILVSVSAMFRWIFRILFCTSAWVAACSCALAHAPKPLENKGFL